MTKAYILGALHDATKRKTTYRIGQKSKAYLVRIANAIQELGGKAWIYREGKTREFYILEFAQTFLRNVTLETTQDYVEYIQGYFDTDGGIAKSTKVRFYLYFCQKNLADLLEVQNLLEIVGIKSGAIHNPSKYVDPNYWRFFISAESHKDFAQIIGSQHPEKQHYLRTKI